MKTLVEAERKPRKGERKGAWWYLDRDTCSFHIEIPENRMIYSMAIPTNRIRRALATMDRQIKNQKKCKSQSAH